MITKGQYKKVQSLTLTEVVLYFISSNFVVTEGSTNDLNRRVMKGEITFDT